MPTPQKMLESALAKRQKTLLGVPINTPSPVTPTAPVAPTSPTKPGTFKEFVLNEYGGIPSAQAGEEYAKLQEKYKSDVDKYEKANDKYGLETNYNLATGSLTPAKEADVSEYQRISPLAQRRLLGQLNSRGLGSSVLAGGAGSGMVDELTNRQSQGLYDIKSGYQDLANTLEKQKAGDLIDMDSFYRNLATQRERARMLKQQNQFGFEDLLGLGVGVAGLL